MKFARVAQVLLTALPLSACIVQPLPYAPASKSTTYALPRLDLDAIAVQLGAHDGVTQLEIQGTQSGSIVVRSAGTRVLSGDGVAHGELRVVPADGELLVLGGRPYEGVLLIRSQAQSGLRVTNLVQLEHYVRGVVAGESVLWSATPAELEAQAVCARSYAIATLQERLASGAPALLWDDTRDQVYLGAKARSAGARSAEIERKLDLAIEATAGRVLGLKGRVLDTRFHAACGGTTARFSDIFGEESIAAQMPSVRCGPCTRATGEERDANSWSFTASRTELARLANKLQLGTVLRSVRPMDADAHGRWLTVEMFGDQYKRTISSAELRRELGATRMSSARVNRAWPEPGSELDGGLYLEGYGRGHGVGLCQVGSRALARQGWSTQRILSHYYPGSLLGKVDHRGRFRPSTAEYELE